MVTQYTKTDMQEKVLNVWAQGCAHVSYDKLRGRESLADALRQSEFGGDEGGPSFDWDLAINVGDYSAAFGPPNDQEGVEIVRQFGALKKHRREDIYSICGNHDRDELGLADGAWFQKWIDPMGHNPALSGVDAARYRYPVNGSWERYSFEVGNVLFLMMSDVNELTQAKGRGELGGNPGGVVREETFNWWVDQVERHKSSHIIVTAHHYVLKDTTVASGEWEGMQRNADGQWQTDYHGYYADGTPHAASYLYWVAGQADAQLFEKYLHANPGAVDVWLGGHTHTNPDDNRGNKTHIERRYGGTTFINVAALTRYFVEDHAMPMSRLLAFAPGSSELNVKCYMHTSEYRPQGWYEEREVNVPLSLPFSW